MDPKVVNFGKFMDELTAGVKSAEALVAKVTPMLNDPSSPNYIEPGTQCSCDCGLSLREHIQQIVDSHDHAERLVALAKYLEMLKEASRGQDEDRFVMIIGID